MIRKAIFHIALIHLVSRMRQSIVAALGVTFGIGVFIGMVGLMTGINKFFEELMLENTAHVHVYNDVGANRKMVLDKWSESEAQLNVVSGIRPKINELNIKNGLEILRIIQAQPEVYGASPLLSAQVFYNSGNIPVNGLISGVEILEYDKLFNLSGKMDEGNITNLLSSPNALIIGAGLAEKLGVKLYDQITITAYTGIQLNALVVGIYSTGVASIDNVTSFATLNTVQKILGREKGYFTDINIRLHDISKSQLLAKQFQEQFGYRSDDWKKTNSEVLVGFTLRNSITIAVSISLLIVAAFGIYNILTMMIYEKMKDIAILKATGYEGRDIRKIFLTEALLIGCAGGLTGLLLGYLISLGLSNIPIQSAQLKTVTHLPVNFDTTYYIFGLLFALLTTFLAGWFPAKKASKVDPVEIFRG